MRGQRPAHLAPAIDATAEHLPFADDSFDAAMATVTIHQWPDPDRGLSEMRRVSRGPVVVLTFDGDALHTLWLAEYAPELIAAERHRYPGMEHICEVLGGACTIEPVPIPIDCVDGFMEAYYARPERFLEPAVRKAQSAWGFISAEAEARAVSRLRTDLASGEWDRRHGMLRRQPAFVGALRLITANPHARNVAGAGTLCGDRRGHDADGAPGAAPAQPMNDVAAQRRFGHACRG
jgi:SAM-dependent methyltransferase